jgi:WD40 repeat protein
MAAQVDWQQRALDAEAEVARLRKRNRELEDELDLLAVANADLRSLAPPAAPAPAPAGPPLESFAALRVHGASRALRSEPDRTIDQATGAANATCVALHSEWGLVVGGADGVLRLHRDGAEIQHACGSPPLRLAWGSCLACGCMDGTVRFYNTSKLSSFDPAKNELPDMFPALDEYNRARDHTARIVSIAWGEPFGQYNDVYIATCARDKTVNIYDADDVAGSLRPLHTLVLPANPESLCFCPGGKELIIYCRGEPFRRHVKIEGSRPVSMLAETRVSVNETRISLNANDWDTHCSFAVLDMAVSPDGKYLACATDANKHIIYPLHSNEHVRVLVGHTADEYANARIAWLGESVVSNSQKDPGLYQWDIGSGKVLKRIERAHGKTVRDLAVANNKTLATCSFDKAAKLWSLCV